MRRLVIVLVAALLGTFAFPLARPAAAQDAPADPVVAEREFVERIDALRVSKGLAPLEVHPELVAVARAWARRMADADEISHNPDLARQVRADWQKLGENVGVGMTVPRLHDAFVKSPAHYRNLVDPDFTHVGVGVAVGRDGALFTAHQFMKLRPAAAAAAAVRTPPTSGLPPVTVEERSAPARLVLVLEQLHELDPR